MLSRAALKTHKPDLSNWRPCLHGSIIAWRLLTSEKLRLNQEYSSRNSGRLLQ